MNRLVPPMVAGKAPRGSWFPQFQSLASHTRPGFGVLVIGPLRKRPSQFEYLLSQIALALGRQKRSVPDRPS